MSDSDFLIISPIEIRLPMLSAFSLAEAAVSATYSKFTTYAAGDLEGVFYNGAGFGCYVFRSLQDNNLNHAEIINGFPIFNEPLWWRFIGIAYLEYSANTTYGVDETVSYIGTTYDIDAQRTIYINDVYRSLAADNIGNPLSDATKWQRISVTNRMKMFDGIYGSQTEGSEEIVVTLTPGQSFTSLYLDNLDATSVTVTQTVSNYARTISLINYDLDWYSWFFRDYTQQRNCLFDDIPSLSQSALTITISNPGAIAKCGLCVIGTRTKLGRTLWGVNGGILSFSGTTTDAFGNTTFLKRANARRLNFDVFIDSGYESEVFKVLDDHTDMPLVIIGSSLHEMCMAYGFLGEWNVPLTPGGSVAQIEIKSLV